MSVRLSNEQELHDFERGIVDLIQQSALQRADHLTEQAIDQFGAPDLRDAAERSGADVRIEGWETLCADLLEVDRQFRNQGKDGVKIVRLSLINRMEAECLNIERAFFDKEDLNEYRLPDGQGQTSIGQSERLVRLSGLESLMAIQRRKAPPGDIREAAGLKWRIDSTLSGLLLIVRYQQAVDRHLLEQGLPRQKALVVGMDHVAWPMEAGIHDFGPQAWRYIGTLEHASKPLNAAAEILAERAEKRRADFQNTFAKNFAERREIHRMLRYFPFYRFRARNQLAALWEQSLDITCNAVGVAPASKVSWRMSKDELTRLLRRIAEAKQVPDVEAALDPAHTDRLHETWRATAKATNFKLGPGLSLFQVELAAALHTGGPWVEDRWEHAKPYGE